jgi:outer membrane lipoprotein SlyB
MKTIFIVSIMTLFLAGCASTPQLYPNTKLKDVGKAQAKADIATCTNNADDYLESPAVKKTLKGAATGAVIGGAIGVVSGLFTGNIGRSAAVGAAVGGTAGGVSGALSPDQVKRQFINKCLKDKGYDVIGWS